MLEKIINTIIKDELFCIILFIAVILLIFDSFLNIIITICKLFLKECAETEDIKQMENKNEL